jgi:tight adherence protein B
VNGAMLGSVVVTGLAGATGAMGVAAERAERTRPTGRTATLDRRPLSRRTTVTICAVVAALLLFGPFLAVLAIAGAVGGQWIGRIRSKARRAVLRDEQLVDAVTGLGAALRAGLSLDGALRFVAAEAAPPLDASLRALVTDLDLGEPMDAALERWALANGSADARLLAGVLRLDRRSGGDLPRILDQVAATLRERREAEGEVRALTAQARLSGLILGLLPIGFFLFLLITSTRDVTAALHTGIGIGAVALGSVLEVVAFLWIRHLLEVR